MEDLVLTHWSDSGGIWRKIPKWYELNDKVEMMPLLALVVTIIRLCRCWRMGFNMQTVQWDILFPGYWEYLSIHRWPYNLMQMWFQHMVSTLCLLFHCDCCCNQLLSLHCRSCLMPVRKIHSREQLTRSQFLTFHLWMMPRPTLNRYSVFLCNWT